MVEEAEAQRFPDSELLQTLIQAVTEAEKCATVAAHLATKKVRTRLVYFRGINFEKKKKEVTQHEYSFLWKFSVKILP